MKHKGMVAEEIKESPALVNCTKHIEILSRFDMWFVNATGMVWRNKAVQFKAALLK